MVSRLPDEFFRRRPEPAEVDEAPEQHATDQASDAVPELPVRGARPVLVPVRIAAVLILVAAVAGFFLGQGLVRRSDSGQQSVRTPTPTASVTTASSSPIPSEDPSAYDGETTWLMPTTVATTCDDVDPNALVDASDATGWECEGSGVGERIVFQFSSNEPIVGVKIASGNAADSKATAKQRQVVSVRWRFSDGSWFEQGLSGSNGAVQQVGFPETRADSVTLEVLETTAPLDADEDRVTVGAVQFLRTK